MIWKSEWWWMMVSGGAFVVFEVQRELSRVRLGFAWAKLGLA